MNPDIKKRWITALRSGEYKQGKNTLRPTEDTYCCLGVLCDLYILEHSREDWEGLESQAVLPHAVVKWAELTSPDPFVREHTLASFNDKGTSFEDLAAIIQEDL